MIIDTFDDAIPMETRKGNPFIRIKEYNKQSIYILYFTFFLLEHMFRGAKLYSVDNDINFFSNLELPEKIIIALNN